MSRIYVLAIFAILALVAAGCNRAEETTDTDSTPTASPTASPTGSPTAAPAGAVVDAAESSLGMILTDGDGRSLYIFLNDSGASSRCTDACAQTWPPYMTDGNPIAGPGVDQSLISTGGGVGDLNQVTYNGRPLYHFSGDNAPGDTNGQGTNDLWYVMSPEGEPIRT